MWCQRIMTSSNLELPFGPPPVLVDVEDELKEYLKPEKLSIHNDRADFKFWPRTVDLKSLYDISLNPVTTTLKVNRDPKTGELIDFHEVPIESLGLTASNSTSFLRPPGKLNDDIKGNTKNYPFWPGGFDPPSLENFIDDDEINFENDLISVVPGLSRSINFSSPNEEEAKLNSEEISGEKLEDSNEDSDIINLHDIIDLPDYGIWSSTNDGQTKKNEEKVEVPEVEDKLKLSDIKMPVLRISKSVSTLKTIRKTEFAEMLDATKPVDDFEKRIPNPAKTWNFELDSFQKLAIIKLEEHKHVFVAAHTSAGKTVVAEYAIALSEKHRTKAIYTSPIKALSNQKYRDFKDEFGDVGLITGDIQINEEAFCLVMTTEILRSMIYGGSNVIRDLEYVIFDEVHYINNSERGHVYEEILIMLPDTVCIVMLSATVPNELQFADWVGRTKSSKMFVVSTVKRVVPLQHYLYTGIEHQKERLFLIRDAEGPFLVDGYRKACESTASGTKAGKNDARPVQKSQKPVFPNYKQYWISLARYLQKNDKLPVVTFMLSRKKCDENADCLASVDFTTAVEKSYIKHYFRQALQKLKLEDQKLPQVQQIGTLLENGIGIHHSGILPILKEIVEILFQKSHVKFLFATETFAMGVNMPARTVIFGSMRKFDGKETRNLLPEEYIQMAGRAGRRGKDTSGTVILLFNDANMEAESFKSMMFGKPMELKSQFTLTYSMLLRLFHLKNMKIEDVLRRSYLELENRKELVSRQCELDDLAKKLVSMNSTTTINVLLRETFNSFYDYAHEYVEMWNFYSNRIFSEIKCRKEYLIPGRYIVVGVKGQKMLSLLLDVKTRNSMLEFRVLTTNYELSVVNERQELFHLFLSLARKTIHLPVSKSEFTILTIGSDSILEITKFARKIEADLIIKDWEKRQIPRFKNDPPGKTFASSTAELIEKCFHLQNEDLNNIFVSLEDIKSNVYEMSNVISRLINLKETISSYNLPENVPHFETQFEEFYTIKEMEEQMELLKFKLSAEGLQLYPVYKSKLEVLKKLGYVKEYKHAKKNKPNESDQEDDRLYISLKGKIAREMGTNELILTELIFNNCFADYDASEIAALLSCMVFHVKLDDKPELSDHLEEGICMINQNQDVIRDCERDYSVPSDLRSNADDLNFGLVHVVYEWTREKSFAEIMKLVDGAVQEGIIVRCIQQLNDILKNISDAAKLLGDMGLKKKMEDAMEVIKRDIVFAESLYTQ